MQDKLVWVSAIIQEPVSSTQQMPKKSYFWVQFPKRTSNSLQRNNYMSFIVMFEIQEELAITWVFVSEGLVKIRFGTNT